MPAILEPGLPEIKGDFQANVQWYLGKANNAFSFTDLGSINVPMNASYAPNSGAKYTFAASNSNSVYGNSDTVQPPAIALIPQIKY